HAGGGRRGVPSTPALSVSDSVCRGGPSARKPPPRHGRLERLGEPLLERAARGFSQDPPRAVRRLAADVCGHR
ncbi:unnamed protein product, partial [Ectocarpus fasciculatus]